MRHINLSIKTIEELTRFLSDKAICEACKHASSILVQVFTDKDDILWIRSVYNAIHASLPKATVMGCTADRTISNGTISSDHTNIAVSVFESSTVHSFARNCTPGKEYAVGMALADSFSILPNIRGVLLLSSPTTINCTKLLDGINDRYPGLAVFGGGAIVKHKTQQQPLEFLNTQIFRSGVVAVALCGEELQIEHRVLFGWKGLGPKMVVTKVRGFNVCSLDQQPGFSIYQKYLHFKPSDDIFLLEFPLLMKRHGKLLARNPVAVNKNGCVTFIADVHEGERVQLGYAAVDSMIKDTHRTVEELRTFVPQAIFLYSCICRRFFLQEDVEFETLPFQELAPTMGFFTSGEFCHFGDRLQLLNSSQLVVALREGIAKDAPAHLEPEKQSLADHSRIRHTRVMSRLIQFISVLTDDLEEANRELQIQAERDSLTGIFNRRVFDERFETEILRRNRYDGNLSLIMFDLDKFKQLNDRYGHASGDHVLQSMALTIAGRIRAIDVFCRYGGEEFALLLPETSLPDALIIADYLRRTIESLSLYYEGKKLPAITASFGVVSTSSSQSSVDAKALVNAADEELYQSKKRGGNCISPQGYASVQVKPSSA